MLTQAEWAKLYPDPLQSGVVELIVEVNPIMQYMPWQNIAGAAYVYNREQTLPGIAFRGINDSYTESTGVVNRLAEPLKIMGGDLDVDRALISWSTNINDTRAIEDAMKIKSLSLTHLKTVFDGDSGTDPNEFDGLNVRLTGDQVIEAGADGAPLTLAMLDDLVDAVQGSPSLLVMNKKCRQLVRQAARSVPGLTISKDDLGREVDQYYGVPIAYTEFDAAGNPILGFDETVGTANDTASIYALSFGPGKMFGAQTSPISARDLGELESKPAYRTRVEHYGTIVLQHPRCAARLKGVTLH
jgi:hypothetical protein